MDSLTRGCKLNSLGSHFHGCGAKHTEKPADCCPQSVLEPYTYISANPGKEIRSKMIEAFDLWLNVPKEDLEVIKAIVRMLHNASLL